MKAKAWCIFSLIIRKKKLTWTQRAMMSAKRERDFAGYMPFKIGSTIFAKASISCS
jgi:hypothetical protein